ncbi:MAG: nucleoside recognition domain-containing protein [Tannerellaceae bacterium]|jgi:spore maturation protein SpmB|nr:nucleoside recognition domain-containing protein [Tannerellaceae bacterium]
MPTTVQRIKSCVVKALPKSGRTCIWLLKIILPISLIVRLLQYSGILAEISPWLEPALSIIGLPGETAVVFITSMLCPLYAPVAIIPTLELDLRQATILSIICLVAHNLIVESTVQKRTGSNFWEMTILRIVMAFVIAFTLNIVMPASGWSPMPHAAPIAPDSSLSEVLTIWLAGSIRVIVTIVVIVTALMILHFLLSEFNYLPILARILSPLMRILGLPRSAAFLWMVGNLVGLAYGGAIMIEETCDGKLSRHDANRLNYHLALSHSLLEDTLIFVAIGISALWIIPTRLIFAAAVVWIRRAIPDRGTEPTG